MASVLLKKGDTVWVKGGLWGEIIKTFEHKVKVKFIDPVFKESYGKVVLCSEKDVTLTCKQRCCRCNQVHCAETQSGTNVHKGKDTLMWYGSTHDTEVYMFSLPDGWYCYDCLDYLIDTRRTVSKKLCKDTGKRYTVWGEPIQV